MLKNISILAGWAKVRLVVDSHIPLHCLAPYPGHPRGCPNFGERASCPPRASYVWYLIKQQPVYLIWYAFPLAKHMRKMYRRHPEWSDRQLRNSLYWQGTARKRLRMLVKVFREIQAGDWKVLEIPEANCVDVDATMLKIGVPLTWPPREYTYRVAVIGKPLQKRKKKRCLITE